MRMPKTALLLLLATAAPLSTPAFGQAVENRVDRLEKQMKAVQRKVFPGGDDRFFEAEIGAPSAPQQPVGVPATSAVSDLNARVNALESELARLTGQVEQNGFKLRQLEEAVARLRQVEDPVLIKPAAPGLAPPAAAVPAAAPAPAPAPAAAAPATPAPAPAAASTGDAGEDAYMAGYRLWVDKKYPEAQAALRAMVAKYPKHRRASYAQNLLGRAYLDEGKPALAAEAFYANYQKMPRGERAPDSLYYLGQSLVRLKKTQEACRVYDELLDVYGATISASLKDKVTKGRADAKCS